MIQSTTIRQYADGIGEAVADRTINRIISIPVTPEVVSIYLPRQDGIALDDTISHYCKKNGIIYNGYKVIKGNDEVVKIDINKIGEKRRENWGEVATRVAAGNASLCMESENQLLEYSTLYHHIAQASLLMSGRHLQHGDLTQKTRNLEIFTNCATAPMSFLSFYLLLNGSGVGRSYDDEMMLVDWRYMPDVRCVIDGAHADVQTGEIRSVDLRTALHMYGDNKVEVFKVEDSREGWAYAVAKIEAMAYEKVHRGTVLLLDFSGVRPRGTPIGGMQDRPASGPGPLMAAIDNIAHIKNTKMAPWKATMFVDHYLAECVLVGGARRSARMATKTWRDANVLEFIRLKRAIELNSLKGPECSEWVKSNPGSSFLYTSNNSVMVDAEFWEFVNLGRPQERNFSGENLEHHHAINVINAVTECSYYDGTGEPGLINADKLNTNMEGADYSDGLFADSIRLKMPEGTLGLAKALAKAAFHSQFPMVCNPCGEICLYKLGAYCTIADVVPFHAKDDDDAEQAFRTAVRALMRTNTMNSLFYREVQRTNRIGVGITGLHEYAFARFGLGWDDLVDEQRSINFWQMLSRFKRAIVDESIKYAKVMGVVVPHTNTTMKPAGTTSKLFSLSEGAHLPSMREYLRWVQFREDDPLVSEYESKGYPVRHLTIYKGTAIVGFPTRPAICNLGMGDKLVTAGEASPESQYRYLELLEKYWIVGVEEDGVTPLKCSGNQVSYSLKYKPEEIDFERFKSTLIYGQSRVRCCSVMPQDEGGAYEYQPEDAITKAQFEAISAAIVQSNLKEDIGFEHVDCSSGSCPISFNEGSKAA